MEVYPSMFQIARDKNSTIAQNRCGNSWSVVLRRNVQDWEMGSLLELLANVEKYKTNDTCADTLLWGRNNSFTVKDCYHHICCQNQIIELWPWKLIWKTKMPTKIICFCWIAAHEACLTIDNLNKKGLELEDKCCMCQNSPETINHPLLHCAVAKDLRNMFCCIFGLEWIMPQNVKEAYASWNSWRVDKSIKKVWVMIPGVIFWGLWTERNRRCFDGISTPNHSLKASCLFLLFSWVNLTPVFSTEQFLDFVSLLVLV
ncbi:uncharacterized protein LOC132048880 [Lycium ferocissimum]|uniref:uncharacterized protein LOC132048880 n=1 Tax=Lycium ferocissimum TaxID=112874 RepID=UPI0028164263|nr:uncharacterized protein LOC132048880 [Lycium ferocissimum]